MATSNSIDALPQTRRTLERTRLRLAALQGQERELASRRDALAKLIARTKARVELAPDATNVLEFLQERANKRAVGAFETLLSAFIADVAPESGVIQMSTGTERGAPALDIALNNQGNLEDILDGNGGGLTNIVVTGLLYAAQARTTTRPLIVLDEPDCWLKSTRVPAFTKVIADVANPRFDEAGTRLDGVQTLMISHNDIDLIDPSAHILTLTQTDGVPVIHSSSGQKAWLSDDQFGVRWIELENIRRHQHTKVSLSPGLNVLAGDINGGKSTLFVSAFRAMAYGESDDSLIRHRANQAVIRLGLERGVVLEMLRVRKGSPKVIYRRYNSEAAWLARTPDHEGPQERRNEAPAFITDVLRIERIDDLDIQLRSQKQPVFLLNEPPSRRAQLLSVGRESGLLHALMERHRLNLKRDRDAIRRDEVELARLNKTLDLLHPLSGLQTLCDLLTSMADDIAFNAEQAQVLKALLHRLIAAAKRLSVIGKSLIALPGEPGITDTRTLLRRVESLARNETITLLSPPQALPDLPKIFDTRALATQTNSLSHLENLCRLADCTALPDPPQILDVKALSDQTIKLTEQATAIAHFERHLVAAKDAERAAETSHNALLDSLGVCPLCDTPLHSGKHHHAALA